MYKLSKSQLEKKATPLLVVSGMHIFRVNCTMLYTEDIGDEEQGWNLVLSEAAGAKFPLTTVAQGFVLQV